jgi:hypothetical protein
LGRRLRKLWISRFSHTRATTAKARPTDACVENEQLLLSSTPVSITGYADPILRGPLGRGFNLMSLRRHDPHATSESDVDRNRTTWPVALRCCGGVNILLDGGEEPAETRRDRLSEEGSRTTECHSSLPPPRRC